MIYAITTTQRCGRVCKESPVEATSAREAIARHKANCGYSHGVVISAVNVHDTNDSLQSDPCYVDECYRRDYAFAGAPEDRPAGDA